MNASSPEAKRTNGVPLPQLARFRKRAGLSQRALAARAGLSMQTISRLERGANARYVTINLLARALQVAPARLVRPLSRVETDIEP
jgi:transcriptional regulator with XRE-family HTH domain